jgi:hypothetical protein
MRPSLLVLFLLLLTTLRGHAQTQADSAGRGAAPAALSTTPPDSVQAVKELFKAKRTGGSALTGIGLGILILSPIVGVMVGGFPSGDTGPTETGTIIVAGLGTLIMVPGVIQKLTYGHHHEAAVLEAYGQGKHLPAKIRMALQERAQQQALRKATP